MDSIKKNIFKSHYLEYLVSADGAIIDKYSFFPIPKAALMVENTAGANIVNAIELWSLSFISKVSTSL